MATEVTPVPEIPEEVWKQDLSEPVISSDVRMSSKIGQLVEALAKAQLEFKPVVKDTKNPYYGSMYADLASVIAATQTALAKNGLVVMQSPEVNLEEMTLTMTSLLMHSSGAWLQNRLVVPATMKGKDGQDRFDAQSVGSASTYTRRYAYQSLVGVAAEADDDGNAATGAGNAASAIKAPQRKSTAPPSPEEVQAAFAPEPPAKPPVTQGKNYLVTIPQVNRLFAIANAHHVPKDDVEKYITESYGLHSSKELTRDKYDAVVAWVEAK